MRPTILAVLAATGLVLVLAGRCHANEGTGTVGFCERHGCEPGEGPALECPDLVCPDVVCQATDCSKTTVVVNPTPCPPAAPVVFPRYYPCRQKKDGTYVCPRKATPHRAFLPETDPGSGK